MAKNKNPVETKTQITDEDKQPGVVYIGHVPHGFFEKQLRQYFSQFGIVLEIKLSRSKKTGNSKGYAFVKFKYAAVAKTVAETCHNYLFFNKLLKCEYRPLSQVHEDTFHSYRWKANYKNKRQHNSAKSVEKLEQLLQRSASRKQSKLSKLKDLGIDVQLEDVMNVPEVAIRKSEARTDVDQEVPDVADKLSTLASDSAPSKTSAARKNRKRKAKTKVDQEVSVVSDVSAPSKSSATRKRKAKSADIDQEVSVVSDEVSAPSKSSATRKRKAKSADIDQETPVIADEVASPVSESAPRKVSATRKQKAKTDLSLEVSPVADGVQTPKIVSPPNEVSDNKKKVSRKAPTSNKGRKTKPPPAKKPRKK